MRVLPAALQSTDEISELYIKHRRLLQVMLSRNVRLLSRNVRLLSPLRSLFAVIYKLAALHASS